MSVRESGQQELLKYIAVAVIISIAISSTINYTITTGQVNSLQKRIDDLEGSIAVGLEKTQYAAILAAEGVVNVAGYGGPTAQMHGGLIPKFKEYIKSEYGVDIEVNYIPANVPDNWAKLEAEWPTPTYDVFGFGPAQFLLAWNTVEGGYFEVDAWKFIEEKEGKKLEEVWPEAVIWEHPESGFKWPASGLNLFGFLVRTDLVPQDWLEEFRADPTIHRLLDDRIKDHVYVPAPDRASMGLQAIYLIAHQLGYDYKTEEGLRKTLEWEHELSKYMLRFTGGSGDIMPLIAAEEAWVGIYYVHRAVEMPMMGYEGTFEGFWPAITPESQEVYGLSGGHCKPPGFTLIVRNAPHKHLAREYVWFQMTKVGMDEAAKIPQLETILGARLDWELPEEFAPIVQTFREALADGRSHIIKEEDWSYVIENREHIIELFYEIVVGG